LRTMSRYHQNEGLRERLAASVEDMFSAHDKIPRSACLGRNAYWTIWWHRGAGKRAGVMDSAVWLFLMGR